MEEAEVSDTTPGPRVSVVISTYNSRDLLREALDALAGQTMPADDIEVIVVDDGSTDGTWEFLRSLADGWSGLKILHQPNSGGPSVGRNRGIGEASGDYLYFHDADDWLAADALPRMVEAADDHGADVVVGRKRWVGREDRAGPFHPPIWDADLVRDRVWQTLGPQKLFRASLIQRLGVRFPEDMVQGEDQIFVATCLFAAERISVLGDVVYYYRRSRVDGQNLSKRTQTLQNKQLTTTRLARLIVANTTPGARREALFRRVILRTLAPALNQPFMRTSLNEQQEFLAELKREVLPFLAASHLRRAPDHARMRLLTARDGTAQQLKSLNKLLRAPPLLRADDGVLLYHLSPELDDLLDRTSRQANDVSKVRPAVVRAELSESALELTFELQLPSQVVSSVSGRLEVRLRRSKTCLVIGPFAVSGARADISVDFATLLALSGHLESGSETDGSKVPTLRWDFEMQLSVDDVVLSSGRLSWQDSPCRPGGDGIETTIEIGPGQRMRARLYATVHDNVSLLMTGAGAPPRQPGRPPRGRIRHRVKRLARRLLRR